MTRLDTAPLDPADLTLLVIAKEPLPGRVKTRLVPAVGADGAARLAAAALADTLDALGAVPAGRRVVVLDGRPGDWLPPGWEVRPQVTGGLDGRLDAAFASCAGPALLVGMDTPQVTVSDLDVGGDTGDGWFGPAEDGGFWALGFRRPGAGLVAGVPMSRPDTGARQWRRLRTAGLRIRRLRVLRDVDTPADADAVAAGAPDGRFAAALRTAYAAGGTAYAAEGTAPGAGATVPGTTARP